jgi:uncharacterized membrane protein
VADDSDRKKIAAAFIEEHFPADLTGAVLWIATTLLAIFLPVVSESPLRVVFALPLLLFIPGYCLIAALFPRESDIDLIERFALSFGLSIAVVPLIGLGLNFTPWGIHLEPILVSICIFTMAMILIAHLRIALLPPEERFRIPFSESLAAIREAITPHNNTRAERILNAVLIIAILTAIVTSVFVIVVPKESEHFTEFYVLGANQRAADYPDQITIGQEYPLFIGVGNHEYRTVMYTIETWGAFTEFDDATNTSRIIAMDPLWQHPVTLAHNETMTVPYNLSIRKSGYDRIEFLLFNGTLPGADVTGADRLNASYRDLHLWVTDG